MLLFHFRKNSFKDMIFKNEKIGTMDKQEQGIKAALIQIRYIKNEFSTSSKVI